MARKSEQKAPKKSAPGSDPRALTWIRADLRPLARAVDSLKLDPENARKHGPRNVEALRSSLATHGQVKPAVVRNGVVIAGNGMLAVAREMGWTHIACVEFKGTDAEARDYALRDNRTAELAEWDDEALARAVKALQAEDVDVSGLGWDEKELAELLADPPAVGVDEGPGEVPAVAVSKPGEIYELGPLRWVCPCCGEPMDAPE